jgi:hypothetical protein
LARFHNHGACGGDTGNVLVLFFGLVIHPLKLEAPQWIQEKLQEVALL